MASGPAKCSAPNTASGMATNTLLSATSFSRPRASATGAMGALSPIATRAKNTVHIAATIPTRNLCENSRQRLGFFSDSPLNGKWMRSRENKSVERFLGESRARNADGPTRGVLDWSAAADDDQSFGPISPPRKTTPHEGLLEPGIAPDASQRIRDDDRSFAPVRIG